MKVCTKCGEEKPLNEFYKRSKSKDGFQPCCKECSNEIVKNAKLKKPKKYNDIQLIRNARYRENNREKERTRNRKWHRENGATYYEANRYKILKKNSNWLKNNKGWAAAKVMKRRTIKMNATPKWLTDIHFKQIQWYYNAAAMFTNQTGVANEVDHIHPLNGRNFSGLHVPWNLRVIKAAENRSKGNKPPADEAHLFWSDV